MTYARQTPGTDQTLVDQPLEDGADVLDKSRIERHAPSSVGPLCYVVLVGLEWRKNRSSRDSRRRPRLPSTDCRSRGSISSGDGLPRLLERQKRYPAGTSNSTNVRLTGQNSELFQWLALQLLFAADKDSLPTDSGVPP
jgi:hypothetical protein